MPRKSGYDIGRLNRILQEQRFVISRSQVLACGMSPRVLQLRTRPSGPWQRLLPGVYVGVTGGVTQDQREMAALLYAGPGSVITGSAAVRRHHLRSPGPDAVEALAEVGNGVRSVAEADFRTLILRSGLPKPIFNARLFDAGGTFIATVDAWWPAAGVAAEVDSRAYHLSAADQDRTTNRHDKLLAHGIFPLHFTPKRIRTDAAGVVSEIQQTLEKGLQRAPLPIKGLPQAA